MQECIEAYKSRFYDELSQQLSSLIAGEKSLIANTANFCALLYERLSGLNWAGFYFYDQAEEDGGELVLGPFQGRPACIRISMGKGVCGSAAQKHQTLVVDNVHEFSDHIACDNATNSEIVIPLIHGGELLAVLDLDSPLFKRFDQYDQQGLEHMVELFMNHYSQQSDS